MPIADNITALEPDIASLPTGEWLKAPVVFGWLACGTADAAQQLYAEVNDAEIVGLSVWGRNPKTPAMEQYKRLGAQCDAIVAHLRAGALRAYIWRTGEIDPTAVPSNWFSRELTIGVFDGKLRRTYVEGELDSHSICADPSVKAAVAEGLKSVEAFKEAGLTGDISFRRADVVALFERQPPGNRSAKEGFLFLDEAIGMIRSRTNMPKGPAIKEVLRSIASKDVRFWMRSGDSEAAITKTETPNSLEIDLSEFRRLGHSGIGAAGSVYHLHRFMLSEDDFHYWLTANFADQAAQLPVTSDVSGAKKKSNGRDFRDTDAPLLKEMGELLAAKKATSPEDAARAVVDRAAGNGKPESKVARLALRFREPQPVYPVE